ncbi:MAG TPA: 2-amino-4-hydroxy-6-hydroxymethyldihydropteridine diphosphokinase [Flavisolibacter sp.]|nr:2-amino-4-hydroxy-6-hydroxymethyldihydropteridine diphosphokinase [Flavisolibacter sp.]
MNVVYLLIGGNIGDRLKYLSDAAKKISEACGPLTAISSVYETAPWGVQDQEGFLNQALRIETAHSPRSLLSVILHIEEGLGRKRSVKYGPRIIDIDIIFFNDAVINEGSLIVPHPQMQNRRFVLEPLNEIAPQVLHPVLHKTVSELLDECPDPLAVNKIN